MNPAHELETVADYLRWMATTLSRADVHYGHGTDNAWDEALALLCGRLGLSAKKIEYVLAARLTAVERRELVRLLERRIVHREPGQPRMTVREFGGRELHGSRMNATEGAPGAPRAVSRISFGDVRVYTPCPAL